MLDRPYGLGSRGQGLLPPGSRPNPNRGYTGHNARTGMSAASAGFRSAVDPVQALRQIAFELERGGAPTYRVLVAGAPGRPGKVAALAQAPPPRTVVWLDGLRRCLDGEYGLTGGVVRALLNAPNPVVIIGTLWRTCTPPTPSCLSAAAPIRAPERELQDLAAVVRIDPEFSPAEQDRARAAAARDPRLRIALPAAGSARHPAPAGRQRPPGRHPGIFSRPARPARSVTQHGVTPRRRPAPAGRAPARPGRAAASQAPPRPRRRVPASHLHSVHRTNANPVPLENRIRPVTRGSSARQAACMYSLIRPPRTGYRRICCLSTLITAARGAPRTSSGMRWAMPWCGRAVL